HKLRENENKIIQRNNELRNANEELKTYDYAVAHDLKNPISVIRSYISLIQEENPDQSQSQKYLERIRNSADDAMQIIKELLHFSDSNVSIASLQLAELEQVTNNCERMLENEIKEKNVLLNRKFDLLQIKISKFVLQQILSNLISNAIKYCPAERQPIIEIISYRRNNNEYIEIIDNGVGISKSKISHIFDLHSRLHEKILNVKGDGIGLFNVKKLVERSGGNISVTSQEDIGTRIKIEFIRNTEIESPHENSITS
ncbi:MAG: HAMP domain-containing histidine kinase, partial [Methyloprofundus sp.]|nr:HAMP domain-containing histidine kinase [Methyloprofundus sp.]